MRRSGALPVGVGCSAEAPARTWGFSLVELMVSVTVAAVLLSIAIPAFSSIMAQNRLAVTTNAARGALMAARQAAVMSGRPATLCPGDVTRGCTADWSAGAWLVFRDANRSGDVDSGETILDQGNVSIPGGIHVSGNGPLRSALVYMPAGHAERLSGAFGAGRLRVCVEHNLTPNARELVISASGRVRLQRVDLAGACPPL